MRLSANLSMLFTQAPFFERFELAARAGFDAVECWFPYEIPADTLNAELRRLKLQMIGINTAPGSRAGDFGLCIDEDRQDSCREGIDAAIGYARTIGCTRVHVLAGMRGVGQNEAELQRLYEGNLGYAARSAALYGIEILIEPLNATDRPGYFLSRLAHAKRCIEAVGQPNLKLMFDVYHVQMSEGQIVQRLRDLMPLIGHVQVADVPGRHEPGTGEINYAFVLSELGKAGYTRPIGLEYKPLTSTEAGLVWSKKLQF